MAGPRVLSPAYAKRIASALARGKTVQEARGHRPGEARARKVREREQHGISSYDEKSIRHWVNYSFNPHNWKDIDADEVIEWAQQHGYEAYRLYRDTWWDARRTYLRELRAGEYETRQIGYLEAITATAGVEDLSWLYYH